MTPNDHKNYAADILFSLEDSHPDTDALNFVPNPTQSRNAARAMTTILCHRLLSNSKHRPTHKVGTTFEWKPGTFNCRNIADRDYLWTNMRRSVANEMHETARSMPVAYLLACCKPAAATLNVWAIPEPLLHDALASILFEEGGQKYTVEISTDKQRIERYDASPDLTPYFRQFRLTQEELLVVEESRAVDALVKRRSETKKLLARTSQQLKEAGAFDPSGIADARKRVLSSIVRRRGQPAFRQNLLAAYNSRCAVTGCDVEAVLEAAHIVPYMGPETNHPGNGLLLRTDLHTLFDLMLIAVDAPTMSLLVSPMLANTCYEEYRGRPIRVPDDRESQPSQQALEHHRLESGL
jgi:hypothetical protein